MAETGTAPIRDAPTFRIDINGRPLPKKAHNDVLNVKVTDSVDGISCFELLVNIWDPTLQEYIWIDEAQFAEGNKVVIKVGFLEQTEISVEGEITGLEPIFEKDRTPVMIVRGYDLLHRLKRGRQTRTFAEITDSALAAQLASEAGLRSGVQDTAVRHAYLMQNNQSNYDFLKERADRLGYEPFVKQDTLLFRPKSATRSEAVKLHYGTTVKSFYPLLTTLDQVSRVEARGWDPLTKQPIIAQANSDDVVAGKLKGRRFGSAISAAVFGDKDDFLVRTPVFSEAEARQIAAGNVNRRALGFIRGEAAVIGTPKLKAGDLVIFTKLGTRFSGEYYVTSSTHIIDETGYTTEITVERTAT
jgi:phage protein D